MNQYLFAALFLLSTVNGLTYKQKLDQKVCTLGLTFLGPSDVAKGTTCMEPLFYDCKSMEEMKESGMGCALKACPSSKYMTALTLIKKMDTCVKPSDTMAVLEKAFNAGKAAGKKVYDKVIAAIKKAKKAGKSKAAVNELGYKTLVACITKPLIETICGKIVPVLNKVEWDCMRTVGKDLVDFSQYACAKIEKKA